MKTMFYSLLGIGLLAFACCVSSAEEQKNDPESEKPLELQRYCRAMEKLVDQYYPEATMDDAYDKEIKAEKIHFQYNTQKILMRYRNKDGSWQEPEFVYGPYVGGIWCDVTLHQGPYRGNIADADQGVTEAGPDFYSYFVAPYSKKLDQHIAVKLRYPGGTPPEFLESFYTMAKSFEEYMGQEEDD